MAKAVPFLVDLQHYNQIQNSVLTLPDGNGEVAQQPVLPLPFALPGAGRLFSLLEPKCEMRNAKCEMRSQASPA